MRQFFRAILVLGLVAFSSSAWASEFCDGFEEGYKAVKGDMVIVPICPVEPITPIGSTPFREGIKAGVRAANQGQ